MSQETMRALWYNKPREFEIRQVAIPQVGDDDVLLKVSYLWYASSNKMKPYAQISFSSGVCGTDAHIHDGEFISKFPLIPGHEAVGKVIGDRCVADVGITCDKCFFCRRGKSLLCENFNARGVTLDGGFAEYIVYHQKKLQLFLEPAACAIPGLDKLSPPVGVEVLLLGAGPTGLILAQLLKLNGASRVVIAANKGIKMNIAKDLEAGDEIPGPQWEKLKADNPYGFDIVVEATGVEKLANDAINYVRRGGTLMVYGVYENKALVHWPPSKIFGDEITIIGSFSQTYCFPRAVAYLDSGKVKLKGMVTDVYKLEEYQQALDKMNSRGAVKIAIKP
ncbi:chaperonin 10-like protein [Pisolithus marmoratus]|nr:chaperonin 10-like protein [Pisolithus marmoratus]